MCGTPNRARNLCVLQLGSYHTLHVMPNRYHQLPHTMLKLQVV